MRMIIRKHKDDSDMFEILSNGKYYGRQMTNVWAIVHRDFVDCHKDSFAYDISEALRENDECEVDITLVRD